MQLLKANSKKEKQFFLDLIQQKSKIPIGYYHFGEFLVGDKWKWDSDLSNINPSMKWAPSEPDNEGGFKVYNE